MNYQEIDNYLRKSLEDRIEKSTTDEYIYIHFLNKIENHTTHEYKFLHYLDELPEYDEMCDMEDNFLICSYNEYMYKYRNNLLKKDKKRLPNKTIKKSFKEYTNTLVSRDSPLPVAAFGKKS
tara:strand:- start:35 stop:400 length:366 start_codon:yes stop_codon:yes gene_type:complete